MSFIINTLVLKNNEIYTYSRLAFVLVGTTLLTSCGWIDSHEDCPEVGDGIIEIEPIYNLMPQHKDMTELKMPEGLKCIVYNHGGYQLWDMPNDGGEIYLSPEYAHDILLYNNDTEYIVFNDMLIPDSAYACTRERERASYKGSPFSVDSIAEITCNPPDMLFTGFVENFHVPYEDEDDEIEVELSPVVFQYSITVLFDSGLEYVALARGALAGMAQRVYMVTREPGSQRCTVLFDANVDYDWINAKVNTFGAPYPLPTKGYGLNIEVLLRNGRTLSWDFDVSAQIVSQPKGGEIIVGPVTITPEQGEAGTGAFLVDVNDWGNIQDIDLDLINKTHNQ